MLQRELVIEGCVYVNCNDQVVVKKGDAPVAAITTNESAVLVSSVLLFSNINLLIRLKFRKSEIWKLENFRCVNHGASRRQCSLGADKRLATTGVAFYGRIPLYEKEHVVFSNFTNFFFVIFFRCCWNKWARTHKCSSLVAHLFQSSVRVKILNDFSI